MHPTNKTPTNLAPRQDADEHYREIFSQCGLRYGQHYGSKSGYVRDNPGSVYIANSCVFTSERICCWRGDIDLAAEDNQWGLLEASRRLRRKLFVLREQTCDIQSMPTAWMARAAVVTVWRGQLTFNPGRLPDALSEAGIRQFFGQTPPRKVVNAAAMVRAAFRARGLYLVAVPAITAKLTKARQRQLSPAELAVLARRLAASRSQIEKDALKSAIVRGFYGKPKSGDY